MSQSKKGSIVESVVNIGSGMVLAFCVMQFILVPLMGLDQFTVEKNLIVTIVLTVASMTRSYLWRRVFVNYFGG